MMNRTVAPPRRAQNGAVLMIGMVMLLMLMLVAVGVIRLSTRHTQAIANEQVRTEATSVANYALDLVLNAPATTWGAYDGAGKALEVNLGLTKAADDDDFLQVQVKNKTCKRARIIKNGELIKTSGGMTYVAPDDATCFGVGGTGLTIVDPTALGSPTDDSLCANVLYQVEAQVTDAKLLSANVTVVQGVEVRTDVTSLAGSCD